MAFSVQKVRELEEHVTRFMHVSPFRFPSVCAETERYVPSFRITKWSEKSTPSPTSSSDEVFFTPVPGPEPKPLPKRETLRRCAGEFWTNWGGFERDYGDDWRGCCWHVTQAEAAYWTSDIVLEEEVERVVINLGSDSDVSSDSETDTASECGETTDTADECG